MKSPLVILDGAVYSVTRKAWERLLISWARSGSCPDFAEWSGVKALEATDVSGWTLLEVEQAMLAFLREGRKDAPAVEEDGGDEEPTPESEAAGETSVATSDGRVFLSRPMNASSLHEVVQRTDDGDEVVAAHLSTRQAERMIKDLTR